MDKIAELTILSTVGDYNLKKGHSLIGGIAYALIFKTLFDELPKKGMAWTNNMWNGGTSLVETLVGYWDGETMEPKDWLGAGLIIAGMYLLK